MPPHFLILYLLLPSNIIYRISFVRKKKKRKAIEFTISYYSLSKQAKATMENEGQESKSQWDELINSFYEITSSSKEEALFFLESHNWISTLPSPHSSTTILLPPPLPWLNQSLQFLSKSFQKASYLLIISHFCIIHDTPQIATVMSIKGCPTPSTPKSYEVLRSLGATIRLGGNCCAVSNL